jgi:hypothetical protein
MFPYKKSPLWRKICDKKEVGGKILVFGGNLSPCGFSTKVCSSTPVGPSHQNLHPAASKLIP